MKQYLRQPLDNAKTLALLFWYGLTHLNNHVECQDVKKHYYNEPYDWVSYPKFPEKLLHDMRKEAMAKNFAKYIKGDNPKILDVGCGTGLITQLLKGDVTGLDISPWKLERAKMHVPTANFVEGDAEHLPRYYDKNTFDYIISTDIIEHLEKPHLALLGIYQLLKHNGLYMGTVPSHHIIWKMRKFLTNSDYSAEPFHNYYSIRQLKRKLCNTFPFELVEIKPQCLGMEIFYCVRKRE